jgi:SAM-dependent methyltransferase
MTTDVREYVREQYAKIAESQKSKVISCGCASEDTAVASAACCNSDVSDSTLQKRLAKLYEAEDVTQLPEDVTDLSLGCGDPVTLASLEPGEIVLDLGSGGGIDCFLAAKRVGSQGRVIGVDMTAQMIEKARLNKEKLNAENVEFRLGEIEHLPVPDNHVDVIISNCVINLSPDKPQVFREAFRVLKPGGRLSVSDIVTDGPLAEEIKRDLSAWAGCVAGALDVNEYIAAIQAAGFEDIELTPVYPDRETVELVVDDLDIPNLENIDPETLRKTILSAKIRAKKPL